MLLDETMPYWSSIDIKGYQRSRLPVSLYRKCKNQRCITVSVSLYQSKSSCNFTLDHFKQLAARKLWEGKQISVNSKYWTWKNNLITMEFLLYGEKICETKKSRAWIYVCLIYMYEYICFKFKSTKGTMLICLSYQTPFTACCESLWVWLIAHIITKWTQEIQCQTSYLPSNVAPRARDCLLCK